MCELEKAIDNYGAAVRTRIKELEDSADIQKGFYDVVLAERNYERVRYDNLKTLVDEVVKQAEVTLECFFCNEIGYGEHSGACIIQRIKDA